jgi:hypothetical protein
MFFDRLAADADIIDSMTAGRDLKLFKHYGPEPFISG